MITQKFIEIYRQGDMLAIVNFLWPIMFALVIVFCSEIHSKYKHMKKTEKSRWPSYDIR